jgi:DnaJ-class molecular chaperone
MQVFKDLQRQLHPDKNPQDQEADSKLINIRALPGILCFPMFFT